MKRRRESLKQRLRISSDRYRCLTDGCQRMSGHDGEHTQPHQHAPAHDTPFLKSGNKIEVCECGATRDVNIKTGAGHWHVCRLCTQAWGLK